MTLGEDETEQLSRLLRGEPQFLDASDQCSKSKPVSRRVKRKQIEENNEEAKSNAEVIENNRDIE